MIVTTCDHCEKRIDGESYGDRTGIGDYCKECSDILIKQHQIEYERKKEWERVRLSKDIKTKKYILISSSEGKLRCRLVDTLEDKKEWEFVAKNYSIDDKHEE